MCGCGVQNKEQCSPALRELEECTNVDDAISMLKNGFKKIAVEHNLRVTTFTVPEDFAKMLMKGQLIPPGTDTPRESNISTKRGHTWVV